MTEDALKQAMTIDDIMKMLPHRYPMLLVDRVTEFEPGKYVKGYKNITINEQIFNGHYPDYPVMPGVLQIEAMAQLSGAMVLTLPEHQGKLALFAGIDNARFKKQVRPGDRFDMVSELIKIKGPLAKAKVQGFVDNELAVEAELIVVLQNK